MSILIVQQRLKAAGYDPGPLNGAWGGRTAQALDIALADAQAARAPPLATDGKLSPNFSLAEFTASQTASRKGLDNTPSAEVLANLRRTAAELEKVRALLGKPILVTSGYRSPAVNAAVGGSATSDHVKGLAVDFHCPGFGSPLEVCRRIAGSGLKWDQLLFEHTWVHLGFGPRMRGQVMTLQGKGFVAGLVG